MSTLPQLPKQSAPAVAPDGRGNLTLTLPLYRSLQALVAAIGTALSNTASEADIAAINAQLAAIERVIGPLVNVGGNGFLAYYNGGYNARTISGASGNLTVTGGDGSANAVVNFAAQLPGLFAAGPVSGGSDVPTFRAMVATDLPQYVRNLGCMGF